MKEERGRRSRMQLIGDSQHEASPRERACRDSIRMGEYMYAIA